ncbi:hypothetical protein D9757_014510 [Collybiopsis confluens]|uniref:Uncharacterized protein n=1 Tax=Collybiopsis confluens TaxID=2823264 RepID=A0A8H5CJ83_9AGAR|nr:hypothetical protein D9757_014510 [Collybiopsis confluens]
MDVDPLADAPPPRYAVESDEEDEYNPFQQPADGKWSPPEIKIVGEIPANRPLILASGHAGKYWAKGCQLGEQIGGVYVDKIQVGLVFSLETAAVVVSETSTRLPIAFMHPYAQTLAGQLKASSFSLLDIYPTPTYVSSEPIPFHDAPIRYLSTTQPDSAITSSAERFAPPNIVHSAISAALLSHIASTSPNSNATVLLLPFPRIPAPAPKVLENSDFLHLSEDVYQWPVETMDVVHTLLFAAIGEKSDAHWQTPSNSKPAGTGGSLKNRSHIDDGMYI